MRTNTSRITRGKVVNNSPEGYIITDKTDCKKELALNIQKNPIQEVGRNGFLLEELILIGIDQLEHYQNSDFANVENEMTLFHLKNALNATRARQYERNLRGVQDTLKI